MNKAPPALVRITKLTGDEVVFRYGPGEQTEITFIGLDADGSEFPVLIGGHALAQLWDVLGRIEHRFPAAFRGH